MVFSSFSFSHGDQVVILDANLGVYGKTAIVETRKMVEGISAPTYGVRVDDVYVVIKETDLEAA